VSEANVEFVRGLFAATDGLEKDQLLEALPAMIAEICDPEIEWVETPERLDARTYRGHDGVLAAWTRWLDHWAEYSFELGEVEDHGDTVFVVAIEHGRGAASGAPGDASLYILFTMRDGKIARYQEFYDDAAARAALGGA
jgi:ketosteroid isomerase-like protein